MQTVRVGEEPKSHYVAVVQIKEVTPPYRAAGASGVGSPQVIERQVEDTTSFTVRGEDLHDVLRRVRLHITTAIELEGGE
jgi:DNA helicase HerA-like ATPase